MNTVSVAHALAHSLHALRHSDNEQVFISDLTEKTGYIHEVYEEPLGEDLDKQNIVFATVVGALVAVAHIEPPAKNVSKLNMALAMAATPALAPVICASDEDVEVVQLVLEEKPEWLPVILNEAQAFSMILPLCVGYAGWCDEFAEHIKSRPLAVVIAFFSSIFETGVLPPLSNKLEVA